MFSYCDWSPKREQYHKLAEKLIEHIKKKPNETYDEIVEQFGKDAIVALDYLIESRAIERKGNVDSNHWKIL